MTPVQSQPIGQYLLTAPAQSVRGRSPAGGAATVLDGAFSQIRASVDGVESGGSLPAPPGDAPNPPTPPTPGTTGNSFLDLIAQLMSQLDSVITGLGGGVASGGPGPGNLSSQPGTGGAEIRRLLGTGEVA